MSIIEQFIQACDNIKFVTYQIDDYLYIDMYGTAKKPIEFITLNFVAVDSNTRFEEVVYNGTSK